MKTYKTSDLEQLLKQKYPPPEYAFLPQVRNQTGYSSMSIRTADALVFSLFPSRGQYLHGFEIKISRSDLMNEIKNPEKAESISQYCDFWWIVCPKEIVKKEELPINWGLLIPYGSGLKIEKQAVKLDSIQLSKQIICGIMRKAMEVITPEYELKEKYNEGVKQGREEAKDINEGLKYNYDRLLKDVLSFEKISGVTIQDSWNLDNIAEAVKIVVKGDYLNYSRRLKQLLKTTTEIKDYLETQLKDI